MYSRMSTLLARLPFAVFVMAAMAGTEPAQAHFLWLNTVTDQGSGPKAFLYFSESAAEQDYRLPERVAEAALSQRTAEGRKKLQPTKVETDGRVGLAAPLAAPEPVVLEASCQYGIYHGSLLTYYAKHVRGVSQGTAPLSRSKDFRLDVVPEVQPGKLTLTVLWQGEPLPGAEVFIDPLEGDLVETTTDQAGRVVYEPNAPGLIGIRAGHHEKDASGELDGQPYRGAAYYATLTLHWDAAEGSETVRVSYPELPEAIASFGAAVNDGWLYVYGGHIGETHAHSSENLSRHFRRLHLEDGQEWEELPMQTPLQSPALVAHGQYVYRVGGLTALNATSDQEEDLHSVAEFARFDPQSKAWTEMPALPQPRSSHDAVVIDGKLYVVGGWQLGGPERREWCDAALVYDLSAEDGTWQELPAPEFRRRALAASHWNGKLVVIGGMNDQREVSQRVDFYDPARREWTQGPDLPDSDRHGFGIAACNLGGSLYVSGALGIVYRLNREGDGWVEVAELEIPRFFHRLVPTRAGNLLAVAGAAHGHGHLAGIELIRVQPEQAAGETVGRISARASE